MPQDNKSLTVADGLKALRDDVRGEDALIAARMNWYITSQSFLIAAYVVSWNKELSLPVPFRDFLPVLGIVISVVVWIAVGAAVRAQDVYINEQRRLIGEIRRLNALSEPEFLSLDTYERTTTPRRQTAGGRVIGKTIHVLGRLPALLMPVVVAFAWGYAWLLAQVAR